MLDTLRSSSISNVIHPLLTNLSERSGEEIRETLSNMLDRLGQADRSVPNVQETLVSIYGEDALSLLPANTTEMLAGTIAQLRDDVAEGLEQSEGNPAEATLAQANIDPDRVARDLAGVETVALQSGLLGRVADVLREHQDDFGTNRLQLPDVGAAGEGGGQPGALQQLSHLLHDVTEQLRETYPEMMSRVEAEVGLPEDFEETFALATAEQLDAEIERIAEQAEAEAATLEVGQAAASLDAYVSEMAREAAALGAPPGANELDQQVSVMAAQEATAILDERRDELSVAIERAEESGLDADWAAVDLASQRVQEASGNVSDMLEADLNEFRESAAEVIRTIDGRDSVGEEVTRNVGLRDSAASRGTSESAVSWQAAPGTEAASRGSAQPSTASQPQRDQEAAAAAELVEKRELDEQQRQDEGEAAPEEKDAAKPPEAEGLEEDQTEQTPLEVETGESSEGDAAGGARPAVNGDEATTSEDRSDFKVELANLDDEAQDRVIDIYEDAVAAGEADTLDTDALLSQEMETQQLREAAETDRQDQEDALERGDLETALQSAGEAEYALRAAAARDGDTSPQHAEDWDLLDAGEKSAALDTRQWNLERVEAMDAAAEDYAEAGDFDTALSYAGEAEELIEAEEDDGDDGALSYQDSDADDS